MTANDDVLRKLLRPFINADIPLHACTIVAAFTRFPSDEAAAAVEGAPSLP